MTHGPSDPSASDPQPGADLEPFVAEALEAAKQARERRVGAWDVEHELARAQANLTADQSEAAARRRQQSHDSPSRVGGGRFGRYASVMACVVACVVACGVVVGVMGAVLWGRPSRWMHGPTERMARTYATTSEQRATVTLADGSAVVLAPNSRLDVPADFGRTTRDVTLQGEGVFTVANHGGAPFIVRTGRISARVLGTVFAVRRYLLSEPAQVAVVSGKISVAGSAAYASTRTNARAIVSAGFVAFVTDSTAVTVAGRDLRSYTDWTKGQLVFDRAPVSELLSTVGRWYGYQFHLADSTLAAQPVSTSLDVANRAEMLVMLKSLLDVNMTVDRNVITLTPRQARRSKSRTQDILTPSKEMGR